MNIQKEVEYILQQTELEQVKLITDLFRQINKLEKENEQLKLNKKTILNHFFNSITDYERQSRNYLCNDERGSEFFVNKFIKIEKEK